MSCSTFSPLYGQGCAIPFRLLLLMWKRKDQSPSSFIWSFTPWENHPEDFPDYSPSSPRLGDSAWGRVHSPAHNSPPFTGHPCLVVGTGCDRAARHLRLVLQRLSDPKEVNQPVTPLGGEVRDCFYGSCVCLIFQDCL